MRDNLNVEVVLCVRDACYYRGDDHEQEQKPRDRGIFEARREHRSDCSDIFGSCNANVVVAFMHSLTLGDPC